MSSEDEKKQTEQVFWKDLIRVGDGSIAIETPEGQAIIASLAPGGHLPHEFRWAHDPTDLEVGVYTRLFAESVEMFNALRAIEVFIDQRSDLDETITMGELQSRFSEMLKDIRKKIEGQQDNFWERLTVDEGVAMTMKELAPYHIAYAGDPARGEFRGFSALHDLMDANMILPHAEQIDAGNEAMVVWYNDITDAMNEKLADGYKAMRHNVWSALIDMATVPGLLDRNLVDEFLDQVNPETLVVVNGLVDKVNAIVLENPQYAKEGLLTLSAAQTIRSFVQKQQIAIVPDSKVPVLNCTDKPLIWAGGTHVPDVGECVDAGSAGHGEVVGYFAQEQYLGVAIQPYDPPEWFQQNLIKGARGILNGEQKPEEGYTLANLHLFGTEIRPDTEGIKRPVGLPSPEKVEAVNFFRAWCVITNKDTTDEAWRDELMNCWMSEGYPTELESVSHLLQQIRNNPDEHDYVMGTAPDMAADEGFSPR